MDSTIQRAPAALWDKPDAVRVTDLRPRPVKVVDEPAAPPQRSLGRRAVRRSLRVLLTLGIGIAGTLAWQAFGDDARQMMAMGYPEQLGWIAPQAAAATAPAAPSAPAALASAAPAAPSLEQQQLNALSLNLAAVRQGMEQLATQVAMGQQQMSGDIAKLQAAEQDILNKIATPPRPAPVAARKPAPPPQTAVAPAAPTPAAPSVR